MGEQTDQQPISYDGGAAARPVSPAWRRWLRRAAITGAVVSVLVHLVVMLAAYLVRIGTPGGAGGAEAPSLVEFAVMSEAEFAATMADQPEMESAAVPELTESTLPDTALLDAAATEAIDSLSDQPLDVEIDVGGGDISAGGGDGSALGGGGGGGASFFGLEAQGSRFAYIVDRSSSMRDDNRMTRTQSELIESIEGLVETCEFLVVFYSDGAEPLGGSTDWVEATRRNKQAAERRIRQVLPSGGTRPLSSFQAVFEHRIKPDAIYFMTDGRFDEIVPDEVRAMNRRLRIPVHCVLVGSVGVNAVIRDEVAGMMRRIAADSGGTFVHIDGGRP